MASDYFNPNATPDYMHVRPRSIAIIHPAYDPPHNILIQFPQVDLLDPDGHPTGVHHQTVLLACQIIANNCFNTGFLYYDKWGLRPVLSQVPLNGILNSTLYYFILNRDPTFMYPIVPCFRQWSFPHCGIPACWPALRFNPGSDTRCALTGQATGTVSADVIPVDQEKWFKRNRMGLYGWGPNAHTRGPAESPNRLFLTHNIARCFSTNLFAIVPKPSTGGRSHEEPTTQYCVHVFSRDAPRFYRSYHNMPVANLDDAPREYLFARFAWTVFTLLDKFILAGVPRTICTDDDGFFGPRRSSAVPVSGLELYNDYSGSFGTRYNPNIWTQTLVNQPSNTIQRNHAVQSYIASQPNQPSHAVQSNHAVHLNQPNNADRPINATQTNNTVRSNNATQTNNTVRSNNAVQPNNAAQSNNASIGAQSKKAVHTSNAVLLEPIVQLNSVARPRNAILPRPLDRSYNTVQSNNTALLDNRTQPTPIAGSNYTIIPPSDVIPTSTMPPNNVVLPALSQILNVQLRTPRSAPSDEEEIERYRKRIRTGSQDHDYHPR